MRLFYQTTKSKGRVGHGFHRGCIVALVGAMISLSCTSCEASVPAVVGDGSVASFYDRAGFSATVPSPETALGHDIGERAIRYHELTRYMETLAESSKRVTMTRYGESHKGRALYHLTLTSLQNHKRLSEIKADNAKLSDPRKISDPEETERLLGTLPAVAWLGYSIHGDELSSTDAAVYVLYHLAAARDWATQKLLDNLVIHVVPLMNPDGRERYLNQLEQLTGVVSSPDSQSMQHQGLWSKGRGNHYLTDLNRNWLVQTHPEVSSLAKVILDWNPHLLVDSHEMGAYDTYLLDPPREPLNPYLSEKILAWRTTFGADHAEAFNQHGWSYYGKDWYSEWSPIYTNSWANLLGSIGLLYEQAGTNAASVKQPTGVETTYRESVHHHIVSSLTNLETLATNREEILQDYLEERKWAVSDQGPYGETFLLPPAKDLSRWQRLVELLGQQGIETQVANAAFEAEQITDIWGKRFEKKTLPEGTLVARSTQPHRRMLHTLLAFDPRFSEAFLTEERKELENHRSSRIYDVSAWNLAMAFGLEAYWAEEVPPVECVQDTTALSLPQDPLEKASGYGYVIDAASSEVYPALVALFDNGCHPRVATKPFQIEGTPYQPGTLLLRAHENPDDLFGVLQTLCRAHDISIKPVDTALSEEGPDLGGPKFRLVSAPRVAIASQWPVSTTSFGSAWYLLDHELNLRSSAINIQGMGRIDLRKYNVLILPSSYGLERILDDGTLTKIKRWVEAGGTLIASGSSAAYVAQKDRGLSSVRLKRDVLDSLVPYTEALKRERSARDIRIDMEAIWGVPGDVNESTDPNTASKTGETKKGGNAEGKKDTESLKRLDQWQRIFSPGGAFLAAHVNREHWLGFGLRDRLPVLFMGSRAFMSKHPVSTVVRLDDEDPLRMSGLLWPEARQRLANTACVTVESKGRGQVILFNTDPTFRTWLPGMQRLFFNAVLLGPGLGTSQPVPW